MLGSGKQTDEWFLPSRGEEKLKAGLQWEDLQEASQFT